jgi:alkylation response protein AidB-like acyl-CoA dehydrogenase
VQFDLSDDQELFRETTRRFLTQTCPLSEVRALESEPAGYDPDWWRQGAALGWAAMLVPERHGGGSVSGDGLLDLVIVAEEMGRLVTPGPFLSTNVVAAAIAAAGTTEHAAEVLPGIVAGDTVAAWCHAEPGVSWFDDRGLQATSDGDGWVLRGVKSPVEAGADAQMLLVSTTTGTGPAQFLVPADTPGIDITRRGGIDLTKRFAEIRFTDVEVPSSAVIGEVGRAATDIDRQLRIAVAIQSAETVGAIDRVLEFTLEYVADRHSFGRPLASYQALKHRFADMKMWLEASHGIATALARAVQNESGAGDPDDPAIEKADELAHAAKTYIGPRATDIIQDCVQMHGGIGVTWEHDLHLYLRRATLNREMYGTPAEHRERVAVLVGM